MDCGVDNNDDMGFQNRDGSIMSCPSSGMNTNPFFTSAWDPVVSLSQPGNFGGSSMVSQSEFTDSPFHIVMENQGISNTSQLVHYPSGSSFAELVPKFSGFGSGNFSEMVGSLGLTDCGQIASNTRCPSNYILNKEGHNERGIANGVQSQEDQQLSKEAMGASPNGKRRKRVSDSDCPSDPNKVTFVLTLSCGKLKINCSIIVHFHFVHCLILCF